MPLFHRRGPDGTQQAPDAGPLVGPALDPAQVEAEAAAAIAALERGGIPPKAERRLAELRQGDRILFTSDLSVNEFGLIARAGLRPVSQVMGSSIYHVGWQGMPGQFFGVGRGAYELKMLSDAWNNARRLALSRLQQEARHCGADAVVGVHIRWGAHDFAPNTVEMVAVGTAVRTNAEQRTDPPVLTDLSGQDLWKLRAGGYRAVGVAGHTTVYYVVPMWSTQRLTTSLLSGWSNQELPDFTQALYAARETAFTNLSAEAQMLGAHGVVGVSLQQTVGHREVDAGGSKRIDLIVTIHVLGTAVVEVQGSALDIQANVDLRGGTL